MHAGWFSFYVMHLSRSVSKRTGDGGLRVLGGRGATGDRQRKVRAEGFIVTLQNEFSIGGQAQVSVALGTAGGEEGGKEEGKGGGEERGRAPRSGGLL